MAAAVTVCAMAIAADAPPSPPAPASTPAGGAGATAVCCLAASIHLRNKLVTLCWSSRAVVEVKVRVWLPACGDGSCTTILMEALAEVAGVCWRSGYGSAIRTFPHATQCHTPNGRCSYRQRNRATSRLPGHRLAVRRDRDGAVLLLVRGRCVGHLWSVRDRDSRFFDSLRK